MDIDAKGVAVYKGPEIDIPSRDDLLAEIKDIKAGIENERRTEQPV